MLAKSLQGFAENGQTNHNRIFTIDERLKVKEVWVIVKQNN